MNVIVAYDYSPHRWMSGSINNFEAKGVPMASEIIVNAGREETRVALLENGLVTEIYIDRRKDRVWRGTSTKAAS
jgi:hypothetical protein